MGYLAKEITPEELDTWSRQEYYLVDVREESEFQAGKMPDAMRVDLLKIADHVSNIPKDRKVVVYCKYGTVSMQAAETLAEDGYEAYNLEICKRARL